MCLEDLAEIFNTELEEHGSVVLLDRSSWCRKANSTVRNSSRAALSKSLLEPRGECQHTSP